MVISETRVFSLKEKDSHSFFQKTLSGSTSGRKEGRNETNFINWAGHHGCQGSLIGIFYPQGRSPGWWGNCWGWAEPSHSCSSFASTPSRSTVSGQLLRVGVWEVDLVEPHSPGGAPAFRFAAQTAQRALRQRGCDVKSENGFCRFPRSPARPGSLARRASRKECLLGLVKWGVSADTSGSVHTKPSVRFH